MSLLTPGVFYFYRKMFAVKKIFLSLIYAIFLLSAQTSSYAAEKERESLIDVIMKPVEMMLAPVKGGDLADLLKKPAKAVVMPLFGLGDIAVTPGRTMALIPMKT